MTGGGQLALDLGYRPALGRDDFLVAAGNADAVAWIDRWPDWPGAALVVHGPPGCGKTHLAQVWRARSGALPFDATASLAEAPRAAAWVVDGVFDAAPDDADDDALFHLLNRLAAEGGHVLVTARTPPARWRDRLPDLVSRLAAAPNVAIAPPDDALLAAVLVKLFADRQLRVGGDVVTYLAGRMERSLDTARRLVDALDAAALAQGRAVTVPLARAVLEAG